MIVFATVCRALIRFYPEPFRTRHGDEVVFTMVDRLGEKLLDHGPIRGLGHAVKEIVLLMAGLFAARTRSRRSSGGPVRRVPRFVRKFGTASVIQDLQYAVRGFKKNPGYAAIVILTLGLGIGANTAIFSVVNGVLLRPLPYTNPDRLVMIWSQFEDMSAQQTWVHDLQVRDLRERGSLFDGFAALQMVSGRILGGERPLHTDVARVSADFFDLLGVKPLLGRTFTDGEDTWRAPWAVLLTYDYWTREFGQDPDIVGKKIVVGFPQMEIIGVLPEDFDYRMYQALGQRIKPELWIPHQIDYARWSEPLPGKGVAVLARMKPDVSLEQARSELNQIAADQDERYFKNAGFRYEIVPLLDDIVQGVRPALLLLVGAVGFVLLIATANMTTLVLARTQYRQTEFALRHSLGASRLRIAWQILTENVLLAVVGGALGLGLAVLGSRLLVSLMPGELPRADAIGLDTRVLLFTGAITIAAGILSALAPVWQTRHNDVAGALQQGGKGGAETPKVRGTRNAMVVLEFALSVMLLAGAGLMVRSFVRLQQVDPGFQSDGALTFSIYLMEEYVDLEKRNAFFADLRPRLEALPGVARVGHTSALPLSAPSFGPVFRTEQSFQMNLTITPGSGVEPPPDMFDPDDWRLADLSSVAPGYFEAAGVPLLSGREFEESDKRDVPPVVIVDERLADLLWPDENAVGKRVWFGSLREVVGVARHVHHHTFGFEGRPQLYFPYDQIASGRVSVVVRSDLPASALVPAIRGQVEAIDPLVPIGDIVTMQQITDTAVAQQRFTMILMTAFATAAILLAAIGVYGVLSFTVSQRTSEIAVRIAVGSTTDRVAGLVIGEGMKLAAIGSVLGVVAALSVGRVLESMLFEVQPNDPTSLGIAAVMISGVAFLACWIPARRATSVDPATVLRAE